jgi:hypothetical protein
MILNGAVEQTSGPLILLCFWIHLGTLQGLRGLLGFGTDARAAMDMPAAGMPQSLAWPHREMVC